MTKLILPENEKSEVPIMFQHDSVRSSIGQIIFITDNNLVHSEMY